MLGQLKQKLTKVAGKVWAVRRLIGGAVITGGAAWFGVLDPETAKGICVGVYTAWLTTK